ncbi:MAG: hypothetical protein K1X91_03790 [Bacteriodetes bacterium]|nr:hypothetical protein [Bacteroidota bacterium]
MKKEILFTLLLLFGIVIIEFATGSQIILLADSILQRRVNQYFDESLDGQLSLRLPNNDRLYYTYRTSVESESGNANSVASTLTEIVTVKSFHATSIHKPGSIWATYEDSNNTYELIGRDEVGKRDSYVLVYTPKKAE